MARARAPLPHRGGGCGDHRGGRNRAWRGRRGNRRERHAEGGGRDRGGLPQGPGGARLRRDLRPDLHDRGARGRGGRRLPVGARAGDGEAARAEGRDRRPDRDQGRGAGDRARERAGPEAGPGHAAAAAREGAVADRLAGYSRQMTPTRTLSDGHEMPLCGRGVWGVKAGEEAENAARWALELGYRHIDTAQAYGNEESVGRALADSGVPRDEVFVTTKFYPGGDDPAG